MDSPADRGKISDQVQGLSLLIDEVIDALRTQRDILRQRGMSLPPGMLTGLKDVRDDLQHLVMHLSANALELEQLRALAETTALINSSLNANQVLNEVMDTVIALTGAERGYIVLRDERTGEMVFRIARNLDRESIDEGSFIVSRSIVGEVAQTGKAVLTTNALDDPQYSGKESVVIHALRSILCVPLVVKGQVTGVVYVDNRIKNAVFGQGQVELVVDFANQAAIAIDNAQLFTRVQEALAEVTVMKELMDNVFASIASGVITTDVVERVTTYNQSAERILSVPIEQVLGADLALALPAIYEDVRTMLVDIFQLGRQEMLELAPSLPERGEAYLNLKLTPLKNQDQVTEGVAIVVDDLTEIKRRDATLDVVRRYLPPAMVDNIQSLDELGLGGERRQVSTLFVDVRPFHTFPANIDPQGLMELLNLYLTVGAEAIHNHTGVIDKFMGNEIMGLFNTQLNPSEDHAWWAVQAALKMADDYVELTSHLGEEPVPYYRIGIHTGIATLGNVGSPTRREFTAIGDSINLAKRLQENALTGHIIVSDDTFRHCQDWLLDPANGIQVVERPSIQVKGRRQATQIFEISRPNR